MDSFDVRVIEEVPGAKCGCAYRKFIITNGKYRKRWDERMYERCNEAIYEYKARQSEQSHVKYACTWTERCRNREGRRRKTDNKGETEGNMYDSHAGYILLEFPYFSCRQRPAFRNGATIERAIDSKSQEEEATEGERMNSSGRFPKIRNNLYMRAIDLSRILTSVSAKINN